MHILPYISAAAKLTNIVISNDDGWAEMNIRQLYYALTDAGYRSIITAPADNQSGTGSLDAPPTKLGADGCEFNSCPPYSEAIGHNASTLDFSYVHSYPVTSVKWGIGFGNSMFGRFPDLVVAGVNVGCNLGIAVYGSGTVGAAVEAAKNGLPGIAFSGCTGSQISFEDPVPVYSALYANLSTIIVKELTKEDSFSETILPPGTWLNVNFPAYDHECSAVEDFKFVLARILPAVPIIDDPDITVCRNNGRLPTERSVINYSGCYASISVGTTKKSTADVQAQQFVNLKLKDILGCLPATIGSDADGQIAMTYDG